MKWSVAKIGEISDIIDGDRGKNYPKQHEFHDNGYCLFLNTGNVTRQGFNFSSNMFITEEKDKAMRKGKLTRGDIVFTSRGTIGNIAYFSDTVPYENIRINSGMVIIRVKEDKVDQRYLYQLLKSNYQRERMQSYITGSAQPQLPIKNFIQIELPLPPLRTQRQIADILSAYDDLIENNQKQIKLIEEAAMRLYREWFVNLRFPGHEMINVVDGLPEGWKRAFIEDVCQTVGGGTPSTKVPSYYSNGTIPWVTPTDITRNDCLVLLETEKKITEEGLAKSSAKMLPPETILMTSRASVGFFGVSEHKVCTNQGFISCIPYNNDMMMYLLLNLMNRKDEIRQKAGGSTYLEINKATFRKFEIVIPNDSILKKFQNTTYTMLERIRTLKKQSTSLQQARDKLIPKLMSGEIEV
jgi:type I restriction enzyme S subunit